MKINRRLFGAAVLAITLVAPFTATAEDAYPSRRIVAIVPTEAGSDGDILVRALLERVSARIGQPIVVSNKGGAAGAAGYRELHAAKADGYTIALAFPTLFMNKMRGVMPWNHRDFTLVAQHGSFTPVLIASAKSAKPLTSLKQAIDTAKANPNDLKFALSVRGGSWWLAGMIFQNNTKTKFKNIPQEGSGAFVITQLAGGHTDLGASGLASALSQIDAGNLRVLATFGAERMPGKHKDVPTFTEAGYDVVWDSPNFIIGPPGMPKTAVDKLNEAIKAVATGQDFVDAAKGMYATPVYRSPTDLAAYLDKQEAVSLEIMREAGLVKSN
jgi:tripartite-type tricarboxylate transporter receptor subunit TctC